MKRILFFACFLMLIAGRLTPVFSQSGGTTRILLEQADTWQYDKKLNPDIQRIIGNVVLSHDSAYLYCDSAWLNEAVNSVIAFGNVHIMISDTLNIFGDSIRYDGNTKIARLKGNARLVDNQTVLTSDTIIYDRTTDIARYDYWGKIVNDKNVMVSHYGLYYTDKKEFIFREKVLGFSQKYKMRSDTLHYNTVSERAYFFGPTTIVGKEDSIYTENGWYNTKTDEVHLSKRGKIFHEAQILSGDTMYYNRSTGFGEVYDNAMMVDTAENVLLAGNFGQYYREPGYAFMTDSALVGLIDKSDTLFMHSDSIQGYFDTTRTVKKIFAFHNVRFFRQDLQGLCDSLVYTGIDSTMRMYNNPVVWSGENQLSADTMSLTLHNGKMDSLVMYNSSFIISRDDSLRFNQIKGKDMIGYFRDNHLYKVVVMGNAETVYYVREDNGSLVGINKGVSSNMLIFVNDNKVQDITYIESPSYALFPENELSPNDVILRDFKWEEDKRPMEKKDIFREQEPEKTDDRD
ncbi:MAG TPA: OstA-like protein [Bacteroidales bacterium]|nr:OstA-like protein [Bacteroidales bacterium]HPS73860.1 OstA-like protein [Bacteroidales bacterium]